MLALTPVTIKSTKSMIAMQRLQPEMKKLQAKYKGAGEPGAAQPGNDEAVQGERHQPVRGLPAQPAADAVPDRPVFPYSWAVIWQVEQGRTGHKGHAAIHPKGLKDVHDLVQSKGQMHSWFGMDLSSAPFTHHGSNQAVLVIPYLVLIGMAIFLQYYQMKQMNSRNPQAAAANPQMQQMQKFFPIIFGLIYLRVPAGATIYMVVSSAMRIGTQEIMFRTGMVTPVAPVEREIGGRAAPPKAGSIGQRPWEPARWKPTTGTSKPAARTGNAGQGHGGGARPAGPRMAREQAAPPQRGETGPRPMADGRHGAAEANGRTQQREGALPTEQRAAQLARQHIRMTRKTSSAGAQRAPPLAIQEDKKGSIERGVGRSRGKDN